MCIVDYANGLNTHFGLNHDFNIKTKGYITPSLGSARSTKHFEFKENYEDHIEIPENEDEYYNNQMVEDAKAFAFGLRSPHDASRNKKLDFNIPGKLLMTQGDEDDASFRQKPFDKCRNHQRRIGKIFVSNYIPNNAFSDSIR